MEFWSKHKLALLAGSALLALLIVLAVRPKEVEVDTGMVAVRPMEVTIVEDGIAEIRDVFTIAAPIMGRLERIRLEAGDEVKKGDLVASIRPAPARLLDARSREELEAQLKASRMNLERAENQVAIAKADVDQAERYLERDERRLREDVISEPVLEDTRHALFLRRRELAAAQAARDVAAFELEQAEARLKASGQGSESRVETYELRSPVEGAVLKVHEESERIVTEGLPLLDLGNPRSLEVRSDLLSQDAVNVRPGQKVRIEHWGGDRVLAGRVRRVEPSAFTKVSALGVDEQRVWVTMDFAGPESEAGSGLGHAYRVEVAIVIWEDPAALTVPVGAVFRTEDGWAAYRVTDGDRAERVPLELGRRNTELAQVLGGLREGDRVVLHPGERVTERARLRVR